MGDVFDVRRTVDAGDGDGDGDGYGDGDDDAAMSLLWWMALQWICCFSVLYLQNC